MDINLKVPYTDIWRLLRMFEDMTKLIEESLKSIDTSFSNLECIKEILNERDPSSIDNQLVWTNSILKEVDYYSLKMKNTLWKVYPFAQELYKTAHDIYKLSSK